MVIFNRKDIKNKITGHFIKNVSNIEAYKCLDLRVLVHSKELLRTPKNFCLFELQFLIHTILEENTVLGYSIRRKKQALYKDLLIKLKTAIQNSLYVT